MQTVQIWAIIDPVNWHPGGFCRSPLLPQVARCAPHFGEEPCIAGPHGTGAVFFTGCNLRCVFCQNAEISRGEGGRPVTVPQLREMLLALRDQGVDSIDLVTGAHFVPAIAEALRGLDLGIPVGIAYEWRNLSVDARYVFGLTNVSKQEGEHMRNRAFMLTLGYKFKVTR